MRCGAGENLEMSSKGYLLRYLTKYSYTKQGDISQIQYADGKEVHLSYNPLRQLTEIKDWLGITQIDLDPLGRPKQVIDPHQHVVEYRWGALGERRSMTYPAGKVLTYEYDDVMRLTGLVEGDQRTSYHYDDWSRLIEKRFANETSTRYHFNPRGQLSELIHFKQNHRLDHSVYHYDLMGNKDKIEKHREGLEADSGCYEYRYDPLHRLTDVFKEGQAVRQYTYDPFGNRCQRLEKGHEITYTYNQLNQLLSSTDGRSYCYDKRGNLTECRQDGHLTHEYEFGALNRLERAFNYEKGLGASYQYNGLGHRVGKEEGTSLEPVLPTMKLADMTLNPTKQLDDVLDLTKQYHNLLQRREHKKVLEITTAI